MSKTEYDYAPAILRCANELLTKAPSISHLAIARMLGLEHSWVWRTLINHGDYQYEPEKERFLRAKAKAQQPPRQHGAAQSPSVT